MIAARIIDDESSRSCRSIEQTLKYFPTITVDDLARSELPDGVFHADEKRLGLQALHFVVPKAVVKLVEQARR